LRLLYYIDMSVLRQPRNSTIQPERGARARTRRHIIQTPNKQMQDELKPSVSDVADAAVVSRATAYRYFPSQAALVEAVVDEALGPILDWSSVEQDAEIRLNELMEFSLPRINEYESTFRSALKLSLDHRARQQVGSLDSEQAFKRGHRVQLLEEALLPLRDEISTHRFDQLVQGLSLLFGIESIVVLKDINGLNSKKTQSVTRWAASAMLQMTLNEAKQEKQGEINQE
jgi:AcrR family transcriptional regulator